MASTYVVSAALQTESTSPKAAALRFKAFMGNPKNLTVVRVMEIPMRDDQDPDEMFNGEVDL